MIYFKFLILNMYSLLVNSLKTVFLNVFFRLGNDKIHSCSSCNSLKANFDEINQKLQNCETKKIELRLENKKLKQIVELNLQEVCFFLKLILKFFFYI